MREGWKASFFFFFREWKRAKPSCCHRDTSYLLLQLPLFLFLLPLPPSFPFPFPPFLFHLSSFSSSSVNPYCAILSCNIKPSSSLFSSPLLPPPPSHTSSPSVGLIRPDLPSSCLPLHLSVTLSTWLSYHLFLPSS